MPVKTVLILANSVRHAPNACVAGREVIDEGGERHFGDWVRPISMHGESRFAVETSASCCPDCRWMCASHMPGVAISEFRGTGIPRPGSIRRLASASLAGTWETVSRYRMWRGVLLRISSSDGPRT